MGYVEDLRDKRQGVGRLRYRVRYCDRAGRERAKSFARKVDAERFLPHVEADLVRGQWVDPDQGRSTVGELAERWFATTATPKPKTREDYRSLLDNHVLPAFGQRPVASVDTLAVRGWLAGLVRVDCRPRGQSTPTTRCSRCWRRPSRPAPCFATRPLASGCLGAGAGRCGSCRRSRSSGWPRRSSRRTGCWSALPPIPGCARGELVALRVGRLDLLRGTVRVVESASEVGGRLVFGSTKTYAERTVRLPRFLCDDLAAHLAGRPRDPDGFVFTAARGGPLRHNNFYQRIFCPALTRAGLPAQVRFHDLRHTCAALLIRRTQPPAGVVELGARQASART